MGEPSRYEFRVYQAAAGLFRWQLRCRNGRLTADSGEGYNTRPKAWRAVRRLVAVVGEASMVDVR